MHVIADRIKESSTTSGAGAFALAGALTGYRAFSSVMAVNDTCHYVIERLNGDGSSSGEWEVGLGTLTGVGATLTRTTVLASSNGGATVNFAAGTKHVWLDLPAAAIAGFVTTSGTGEVGIKTAPATDTSLSIGTPSSAGNTLSGTKANLTAPVTNTAFLAGFQSTLATSAAAFALALATHFNAAATTVGAGSTLTEVRGFHADNAIATAATSKGFSSNIAAGAGKYQLYMGGTAASYISGMLALGVAPGTDATLYVAPATTPTASTQYGVKLSAIAFPASASANIYGIGGAIVTANATAVTAVSGFALTSVTLGAGGSITNVYGFRALNAIAVGANNYGFFSDINNAANTFQFYATGTAQSYFGGAVGVFTNAPYSFNAAVVIRGMADALFTGASVTVIRWDTTFPLTATTTIVGAGSVLRTQAVAAAYGTVIHYEATNTVKGAGSTIATCYGFVAQGNLAQGGTNNYGFFSSIQDAGAVSWAFYSAGTAPMYAGSRMFVGTASGYSLGYRIRSMSGGGGAQILAGASQYIFAAHFDTFQADCTTEANVFYANMGSPAATFTTANVYGVQMSAFTKGAGHTVTSLYGVAVRNAWAVGINNYAFYTDMVAGTTNYAFYSAGAAQSRFGGGLGLLNTDPVDSLIRIGQGTAHPSTAATGYVMRWDVIAPATMTAAIYGSVSVLRSATAAYTLANVNHYLASSTVLGAGSTIQNVRGFYANNAIAVGTVNNFGFYSDINDAPNTYQIYMGGSAPSYFGGPVGILSVVGTLGTAVRIQGTLTSTSTQVFGIYLDMVAPATATVDHRGFQSVLRTVAAAYTLSNMFHFAATQGILGSGSTVTTVRGFSAANAIAIGANNFGFYSDINATANTYQLYMAGTAVSYMAAPLQLLTAISNDRDVVLRIGNGSTHPSASPLIYGVNMSLNAPTTATSGFHGFRASLGTLAGAFSIPTVSFFYAVNLALGGGGSTVNTVRGFYAANAIAVGSNNYGFFSDINTQANTYALYAGGTAQSYLGGPVGMNGALSPLATGILLQVGSGPTAHPSVTATVMGVASDYTVPATAITGAYGFYSVLRTAATAFTVGQLNHFIALQNILGAGSTITTVRGFYATNFLAGAGTNTYGFYSDINTAANTYQLYMGGTALNFLKGGLILDTTAAPAVAAGQVALGATTAATVGAAGGAAALPGTPLGYLVINVGGTAAKIPYYNA